jgi:hypothetical protein
VRDLLGHASITTTERYDNQKLENLQAAAARLESGKTFDAISPSRVLLKADTTTENAQGDSESPSICQVFVKNSPDQPLSDDSDRAPEATTNSQSDQDLETWLGGRDSNPDTVVQRAVLAFPSASARSGFSGFLDHHFGALRSVSVRSRATCLFLSHLARPVDFVSSVS